MANPRLEDGWFKIAYELLPVLLLGGFRAEASIVLCEVLAQTYGRGKLATARLDPAKIAARSGRKRPNIWRGIRELTEANVIERLPDGTFKFHKDYAVWRRDKQPVIDGTLATYCASFPLLAKSYEKGAPESSTVSDVDTPSVESDGSCVSNVDTQRVSDGDTQRVSNVDTLGGPPLTIPPESEGELEIGRTSAPTGDGPSNGIVSPPESLPPKWRGLPEAYVAEMAEAREFALTELKERRGAAYAAYMEEFPKPVKGMDGWWWMSAMHQVAVHDDTVEPIKFPRGFLLTILKGYCLKEPTRMVAPPPSANGEAPARQPTPEEIEAKGRAFEERIKARKAREGVGRGR